MHRESTNKNIGTKSVEHLAHFLCCVCLKWWSIGDAPQSNEWYCPWCGIKQTFIDKTPKHPEN